MRTLDAPRNRWPAIFPPLAIVLLMAGGALTAKGLDRPVMDTDAALKQLQIAATHPGRLYLANLLIILGLGALGVSFVVIASLSEGRPGRTIAVAAGVIGGFACFCGAVVNVLVGIDLAGAATAHTTREAAAQVLVSTDTAFVSVALLVVYLSGLLVASILTGVALWRSRAVARWAAIGFPVGMLVGGAAPPGILNVLLGLPIGFVLVVLGQRIWRGAAPVRRTGVAGGRRVAFEREMGET
jgi:hypothetical protein